MFREKVRSAVINAPDAQINPAFAARLRSELKKDLITESAEKNFWQSIFSLKILMTSAALIILTLTIGLVFLANSNKMFRLPKLKLKKIKADSVPDENLDAMWQKISDQAIGDHRHCGLEKLNFWFKEANKETAKKIDFREHILQKAAFTPTEPMKLLHVHDCIFDGRIFTHAVITNRQSHRFRSDDRYRFSFKNEQKRRTGFDNQLPETDGFSNCKFYRLK